MMKECNVLIGGKLGFLEYTFNYLKISNCDNEGNTYAHLCMLLCVRALTLVLEMCLEVRRKRVIRYWSC